MKFRHTAFIELLERAVVEVMYGDGDYEKFKGHRLLAIDGTSLRLPNTEETRKHFGFIEHLNGHGAALGGQVEAKMTVLYDVLNRIPLAASLDKGRAYDLKASEVHLEKLQSQDLVLADRAFGSYRFFAGILEKNANFVIRCKEKTYERYHRLFSTAGAKEVTVEIPKPSSLAGHDMLPATLRLRFIRIVLSSGEVEVLATSLLNKTRYPRSLFQELYFKRWRIETFFHILKSRLSIDNFTGRTVESIYQDVYSTLFISGLESIVTSEADEELSRKKVQHPQKVNKAVAFHTIKNAIIELIFEHPPGLDEKIKNLLLLNPTTIRPDRIRPPRPKVHSADNRRSLYFQRYARKHSF